MEQKDVDKLFRLLGQFYPNARQLNSADTRLAWGLGLKRYRYEDLRSAAVAYAQQQKYFPDLADLTAQCTPQEALSRLCVPPCMARHVHELGQWVKEHGETLPC